jgi:RNA polymerase sigma-70 factor (ECF subfamily)
MGYISQYFPLANKKTRGMKEHLFSLLQEAIGTLKEDKIHPLNSGCNTYAKPASPAENADAPHVRNTVLDSPAYLDDYRLVQKALIDLAAAEVLMRRVYPRIHEVVQSAVGYRPNVDDITQLAAMAVTKSLHRYHGRGSIEAWAAKIAYRKAMRVTQRQWKKEMAMMSTVDENFPDNASPDPEKSMSKQQLLDRFLSKMNKIPSKRRVPLLLHLIYGYTIKEVSELTGAPLNTVKDRLKTASREFQSILDRNPGLVIAMLEELS